MTILIVDDHEQNLYQLQVLLGANGYQVVTATDGAEALAKARQDPPGLIISDILMPVMDGFALCRQWRKDERLRTIPFFFYTATYTDDRDREFALSLGAERFLTKPQEPDVFMRTVWEVIQREESQASCVRVEAPVKEEGDYLKQYNAALIRKLEAKMEALEQSNRELSRDITERKRVEEASQRKTERLRNLHKTDQAILKAIESPEVIVEATLHRLGSLIDYKRASVGVFDPGQTEVRVLATKIKGSTSSVQTGRNVTEQAYGDLEILRQGSMEIVEDVSAVPSAAAHLAQPEGIRSYINVPLLAERGFIGALYVGWEDSRAITPEEKEIVGEVAAQIAIAIEQARLLKETKLHAAELEGRVAERTTELQAANRDLEAFAYSVSHDLRGPLRTVDGFSQVLLKKYASSLDDAGKRVCDEINQGARTMGRLIDDLLAFSRSGRVAIQPSPVDMAEMARAVFLEVTTPEKRERIDYQVGTLPSVVGDAALLHQVWVNLLSNAVKFSSKKERAIIEVAADLREDEVVYSVRDNGDGFDPKDAAKLFGVFQRLHSAKEFEGTGVGLSIVQRIIQRHGGRVWADGTKGKGATFHFSLPKSE